MQDLADDIMAAELLEQYPDDSHGAALLALQWDSQGHPVHVVWARRNKLGTGGDCHGVSTAAVALG